MQKPRNKFVKKCRKYMVEYRELYGGIGKEYIFAKSKSEILKSLMDLKHIEVLQIQYLGWRKLI